MGVVTRYRRRYPIRFNIPKGIRKVGALASGLVSGYNVGRTMTMRKRKRQSSGRGITNEYDRKLIYSKNRMPRRFKRRWRKFKNKILAVGEKDLGSKTVLFNNRVVDQAIASSYTAQLAVNVALYPLFAEGAGAKTYLNDVHTILNNDSTIGTSGKVLFQSAVLDLTACNTSVLNPLSGNTAAPSLEVDVYEIYATKSFEKLTGTNRDLLNAFTEGDVDTPTISGAGTSININQKGCTPWELPSALSEYGIKIMKKTKYFLGPGQTFTYQMRDPRRHICDAQMIQDGNCNWKKVTKWLFIIHKPTPCTSIVDPNFDTQSLTLGVTRKYMYKVKDQSQDKDQMFFP